MQLRHQQTSNGRISKRDKQPSRERTLCIACAPERGRALRLVLAPHPDLQQRRPSYSAPATLRAHEICGPIRSFPRTAVEA